MGLLKNGITIIHFDETYHVQKKLQNYSPENIELQQLKHVNLYCEEDSLETLKRHLRNRKQKGITFIGSGNYHYVSYLLLKEITKPFTLVLFDNHPDLGNEQGNENQLLSCGSWVSHALSTIPLLQKAVIIGPTTASECHSRYPHIDIFPFDSRKPYTLNSILSTIHTQNVYISIDKDVLNTTEAATNWDQGMMDIDTLTDYLEAILRNNQVEGVDICGEARISPEQTFLPNYQKIIQKNETANIQLLQQCLNSNSAHTKGA